MHNNIHITQSSSKLGP